MEYINFKLYDSNDFTNFHVIHEKPEYSQINYVIEKKTNEKKILKNYKTLNNNISNLKQNYEKANSHSNNFSTIDIERYFADSLDIR